HLPLSRAFDVRPGEIPHARGSAEDAHRARSDRAGAGARARDQARDRGRTEEDRRRGARPRQRGGRIRHQRSGAGCGRALDRRVPVMMAAVSTILVYLALIGAIVSFIAGAVYAARAGAGALSVVWPLAIGRIRRAGGEPAA